MRITMTSILFTLMIGLFACGSEDSSDVAFTQINPSEKVYTLEDLKSLGVKKGKTYKVKDLKEAFFDKFFLYM